MVFDSKQGDKFRVTPAVIAALALGLVIVLGLAYMNFSGPSGTARSGDATWLYEVSKRVDGDFNRLSAEEQQRAQKITAGNAKYVIPSLARQQK
jgi:hypothetical protein